MRNLEYTFGKYKLRIRRTHGPFGDIVLLAKDFSYERHLKISFVMEESGMEIIDLTGNNHRSGLQYKGYGTLLVNTFILYLRSINTDPNILLYGATSSVGDPPDDKCYEQNRRIFWKSFNFSVEETDLTRSAKIYSNLENLRIKNGKLIDDMYSRAITLDLFISVEHDKLIYHW